MDNMYGDGNQGGQKSFGTSGVSSADDAAKIFVGGLNWETTSDDLKAYFEQFGTVTDCTIKTDPNTGRPRGFGFVVFADPSSVDGVLAAGTHSLGGKTIDPKRAKRLGPEPVKKVFVGGLDPNTSEAEVREYFGQYGTIEDLTLPFDKINNVRKSFAFITFESEDPVEQLCANPMHTVGGKSVEVKKATQKPDNGFGGRGGGRGGAGGFGGPRGGGRGAGRGGRGGANKFGGGYGQGGWDATPAYGGGYDYSAYGQPAAGPYGQPDPYAQPYNQGYDYSAWYSNGAPPAQPSYGRGRGGAANGGETRYQPYSR
jgi:hypothetical protein